MKYVIGIDEVGRGSLAGPVMVCAVCVPKDFRLMTKDLGLGELRDSKKLTAAQRERWFAYFISMKHVRYEVARVYPKTIDRINISRAANQAAHRAVTRLIFRNNINLKKCFVALDGGLYVGNKKRSFENFAAQTIIKGDEKIKAITIASIIAKVSRDSLMVRFSKKYSQYRFEIHKGYGTAKHFAAIKKYGASEMHRKTFI